MSTCSMWTLIVFVFCTVFAVQGQGGMPPPRLYPSSAMLDVRQTITLICNVETDEYSTIMWKLNETTIAEVNRNCSSVGPNVDPSEYTYSYCYPRYGQYRWRILKVALQHDGQRWSCGYNSNGHGLIMSNYFQLQVRNVGEWNPHITPRHATVNEGDPLTLTCQLPTPDYKYVTWTLNNATEIKVFPNCSVALSHNLEGYKVTCPTNTTVTLTILSVPRVARNDSWLCGCRCDTEYTTFYQSQPVAIQVMYPPVVTVTVELSEPVDNTPGKVSLHCQANGLPDNYTYNTTWLQVWPGYGIVREWEGIGQWLNISTLTYHNNGQYFCFASNGVPDRHTGLLEKNGSTALLVPAPPVIIFPKSQGDNTKSQNKTVWKISAEVSTIATVDVKYYSSVGKATVLVTKVMMERNTSFDRAIPRKELLKQDVVYMTSTVTLEVWSHQVEANGTKATVSIPINRSADLGLYELKVANQYGSDILLIDIVQKDTADGDGVVDDVQSQAFIGVVAGGSIAILVIILMAVVVCFLRKTVTEKVIVAYTTDVVVETTNEITRPEVPERIRHRSGQSSLFGGGDSEDNCYHILDADVSLDNSVVESVETNANEETPNDEYEIILDANGYLNLQAMTTDEASTDVNSVGSVDTTMSNPILDANGYLDLQAMTSNQVHTVVNCIRSQDVRTTTTVLDEHGYLDLEAISNSTDNTGPTTTSPIIDQHGYLVLESISNSTDDISSHSIRNTDCPTTTQPIIDHHLDLEAMADIHSDMGCSHPNHNAYDRYTRESSLGEHGYLELEGIAKEETISETQANHKCDRKIPKITNCLADEDGYLDIEEIEEIANERESWGKSKDTCEHDYINLKDVGVAIDIPYEDEEYDFINLGDTPTGRHTLDNKGNMALYDKMMDKYSLGQDDNMDPVDLDVEHNNGIEDSVRNGPDPRHGGDIHMILGRKNGFRERHVDKGQQVYNDLDEDSYSDIVGVERPGSMETFSRHDNSNSSENGVFREQVEDSEQVYIELDEGQYSIIDDVVSTVSTEQHSHVQ